MTNFCVEKLMPTAVLRHENGILRTAALAVTSDAAVASQIIVSNAKEQADALLEHAQAEAHRIAERSEQETLARAAALLQKLEDTHVQFLERSQDIVIDLTQSLLDRLILEMTPRKKIEAALNRILREAPPRLITPLLRVHPDDLILLPEVEWEVKADLSLSRGIVRLEASNGEWCVNFDAGVSVLKAALDEAAVQVLSP